MTRITVDVDGEWLEAAREELRTDTKVALHAFAMRRKAVGVVAAFDCVQIDFSDSQQAWGYGGGRNLSRLAEDAREADRR